MERELDTRVCLYVYDSLTYIIDIASLQASMFSTLVKLSTSSIEFPFTTSISNFSFYLDEGNHYMNFLSSSLLDKMGAIELWISFHHFSWTRWGQSFYEFPFTICLIFYHNFEVGAINLYVWYRDDICLRFDNEDLSMIFDCTLN